MKYVFRGLRTLLLYTYALPPSVNAAGSVVESIVVGGETAILCNSDGSMARGVVGPSPPGDPYSPGISPSLWESS